ncbi:GlsB/YeaQ/YmgE family stress response membrane protein [Asanoa sp. NPDC050611]|uniref:GlsB/YeaQ/YmgE family stress response membrane protein n=1 Tax=Asanoa sp. NPDC050611 TaxID=3157098 RepID=UPI0033EB6363
MEISGIFTALVVGIVIGVLGRLVLPGRQRIGFWLTVLVGIVAALLGTLVASAVGVADTDNIDWIELALQIAFAAGGVAVIDRLRRGSRHRSITR